MTVPGAARHVRRLLVSMLKGGAGKTTTTVMLALALSRRGYKVVVVDADTRTQGSTDWFNLLRAAGTHTGIVQVSWRGKDADGPLGKFAKKQEEQHDPDVVIIDTGGEAPDVFMSAALYADRLITPVGPEIAELRRMPATLQAVAEIDDHSPIVMSALLTRVHHLSVGKGAAREARQLLDGTLAQEEERDGVPPEQRQGFDIFVQETEIPRVASKYSDVWGTAPDDLGAYDRLADELELEWKDQ